MKKYKQYYQDYYERYTEYMQEINKGTQLWEVRKLQKNYQYIVKVGENLGFLKMQLEEKYSLIFNAVHRVREGTEIA